MIFDEKLLEDLCDALTDGTSQGVWVASPDAYKEPKVRIAIWRAMERWQAKNDDMRQHPDGRWHAVSTVCQMLKESTP